MVTKMARYEMIANQMMKGCTKKLTSKAGSRDEIELFCLRYQNTIKYVDSVLPKSVGVGVGGAMGKAILWYGKEEMQSFCERFSKRLYSGVTDPVHVLWQWLIMNSGRNTKEVYCRTVTAIRAYVRKSEKFATKGFRQAMADLFEWEENYTVMYQPIKNQHGTMSGQRKTPLAD